MDKQDITTAIEIINKDFRLEPDGRSIDDVEQLKKWLAHVIAYLLEKDFERLLQAMYRIDVDERKFKAVFGGEGDVAVGLTELVFERELQKVAFRKRFQ